jgi:hypothetical protein
MSSHRPVKNRSDFISGRVMASMADDYENLEIIIRDVTSWQKAEELFPRVMRLSRLSRMRSSMDMLSPFGFHRILLTPQPLSSMQSLSMSSTIA